MIYRLFSAACTLHLTPNYNTHSIEATYLIRSRARCFRGIKKKIFSFLSHIHGNYQIIVKWCDCEHKQNPLMTLADDKKKPANWAANNLSKSRRQNSSKQNYRQEILNWQFGEWTIWSSSTKQVIPEGTKKKRKIPCQDICELNERKKSHLVAAEKYFEEQIPSKQLINVFCRKQNKKIM